MEVEVKIRLGSASDHARVVKTLSPFLVKTHRQENFFFDGAESELTSQRSVLRVRFSDNEPRCMLSLKGKAVLAGGISRVEEDEEQLDEFLGRSSVADPARLGSAAEEGSRVLRRVRDEFGVRDYVGLGGFENIRNVYDWEGLKLEVDETRYSFGVCYEIECESREPEEAKRLLEEFLKENVVDHCDSEKSKFAIFLSGKLPH